MQATIEREVTPAAAARRLVVKTAPSEEARPYKAPLATFLVLAASGRASARTALPDGQDAERDEDVAVCG